jgi:hypothetical protein
MVSEIIQTILQEKPHRNLYHMRLSKIGGVTIRNQLEANHNFIDGEHKFCVKDIPQDSFIPWTKSGMNFSLHFWTILDSQGLSRSL